jgi:hypothetical protein
LGFAAAASVCGAWQAKHAVPDGALATSAA